MSEGLLDISDSFVLTIFGASGDLARLKIFPSIFAVAESGNLPKDYWIIGYARSQFDQDSFRQVFYDSVKAHYEKDFWSDKREQVLNNLLEHVTYFQGQYDDVASYNEYAEYRNQLTNNKFDQEVFYFSLPPTVYIPVVQHVAMIPKLDKAKVKLVMEKPFGTDEHSATQLFHVIGERFNEDQVYLIDHYLGKRSVRSILAMRHNNRLLNLMLKGREVSNIQISALEPFGVENRLGYFDKVGTFRDMLQSHLLQVMALVSMSIPIVRDAKSFRQEKEAILSALHFKAREGNVCLGQYEGYCNDDKEKCNLATSTFGALKLFINRESWYDTPIYLRSGKFVGEGKQTYVSVELKKFGYQSDETSANKVIFELSPEERLHIKLLNEEASGKMEVREIQSSQSIACEVGHCLSDHALLLLEALQGNQMYFLSFGEIIACWKVMDQVMNYTEGNLPERYERNSDGPEGQHDLMGANEEWYGL